MKSLWSGQPRLRPIQVCAVPTLAAKAKTRRGWGTRGSVVKMFPIFALVGALLGALAAPTALHAQQNKPWEKIPIPKLHDFKPQQPKRIELKNGIVVFLQEDHELPFVSGSVMIPGGEREVDPAKAGLVSLYGQAWRTSGTAKMNGDAMDDFLDGDVPHHRS